MSDGKFYQVLGVGRSASADEIKSAYRELVKRYHPDLFPAAGAKAEATEKLRQINEAYAVLGNPERRKRYDQAFVQKPQPRPRGPTTAPRRSASPRPQARPRRKMFDIPKVHLHFSRKWTGYFLAAAAVIVLLVYAGESVPKLATTWALLEKLEVSMPGLAPIDGARTDWVRVGEYATVSECATAIKHKVRRDQQEGSDVVYDEANGTMAITLYIRKENVQGQAASGATESTQASITKRVRSLECRRIQRVEMESRFRQALRKLGA